MYTKEKISEQYIQLVLEKKTTKITVKEICNYCDISRTTFYKYYKDTYAILEEIVIKDAIEPLKQLVDNYQLNAKVLTFNWYLSFFKHRQFYLIAIHDDSQNALFDTIISQLETYNKTIFSKEPISQQDIDYLSYKNAAAQAMLLKKWIKEGMTVSPDKMADYFLDNLNKVNTL